LPPLLSVSTGVGGPACKGKRADGRGEVSRRSSRLWNKEGGRKGRVVPPGP